MKPFLIITLLLSLLFGEKGKGQEPISQRGERFYRISLGLIPKEMKNKSMGYLVWVTDSLIYYSKERMSFSSTGLENSPIEKISYAVIKSATLNTVNPAPTILLPALAGMVAGGIIGFAQGDDPHEFIYATAAQKAAGLGIFGFAVGATVGGIIVGFNHHVYNIKGRIEKFQKLVRFVKEREQRKNEK
jgi:hypothetical protein